jgi:bifunctional non-homologous end joining protein LigD
MGGNVPLAITSRTANGEHFAYVGRVGTGYSEAKVRQLLPRLKPLQPLESCDDFAVADTLHFNAFADTIVVLRGINNHLNWAKPELVAEIEFVGWTGADLVRQAAFKGLREDKPAAEFEAEKPASPEATAVPTPTSRLKAALRASNPLRKRGEPLVMGVLISNPDKAPWLDARDGEPVTKLDLAHYLETVEPWTLNHIESLRALTTSRRV